MADLDNVSEKLHAALSTLVSEEKRAMVTKWVCLVEVIDEEGKKEMWSLTSSDLSLWDRIGMVEMHNRTMLPETGDGEEA